MSTEEAPPVIIQVWFPGSDPETDEPDLSLRSQNAVCLFFEALYRGSDYFAAGDPFVMEAQLPDGQKVARGEYWVVYPPNDLGASLLALGEEPKKGEPKLSQFWDKFVGAYVTAKCHVCPHAW